MTENTMSADRKRQVETTKRRYGEDYYSTIGKAGAAKKTKEDMKLMAMKRWHPELFNDEGKLIKEKDNGGNK